MMGSRRGFTLIEIILAIFIFAVVAVILFRAFTANKRLSVQSRDRTAAQLLMSNLLEDVRAHPFGQIAPKSWPSTSTPGPNWQSGSFPDVQEIPAFVEGRSQKLVFHRSLSYEGSIVGKGANRPYDVVTAVISWKDPGQPALKSLEATLVVHSR